MSTAPKSHRTTPDRHTCDETLSNGWRAWACGKTAKFFEERFNGEKQWFCGTHAPSERKRREIARREEWNRKNAPRLERERTERQLRTAAPDLLAALKQIKARVEELSAVKREGVTGAAYDVMVAAFGSDITAEFIEAEEAIAKAEGRQ